jgi:squalene-hopene/tetraprenyl-beta-curcumene cyclase
VNSIVGSLADPQAAVRNESQQIVSRFYTSLPQPLDRGLLPSLYEQDGLLLDSAAVHAPYYQLPFSFAPAFPPIRPELLHDIAVASQLLAEHLLLEDKLVDGQIGPGKVACAVASLASKYRLQQSLAYFHRQFSQDSLFWTAYDSLWQEYLHAVVAEKNRHLGRVSDYSVEEMERIAKGKAAMGKVIPWSLGIATGQLAAAEAIAESWDMHSVSRQLYDDVRDWDIDFSDSRAYSFLLTRAMRDAGLAEQGQGQVPASREQIGRAVFLTGWVDRTLAMAERYGERASESIRHLCCSEWEEWLASHQVVVGRLRKDLSRLQQRAVHRTRIAVEPAPHRANPRAHKIGPITVRMACRNALRFLLQEQKLGYPEAAHLRLEWTDPGLRAGSCCVWGETFQRALCTDTLLLARSSGLPVPDDVMDGEVRSLVAARAGHTRGGWLYFGEHTAMCPDADDLGEIVQVIVRAGLPETRDLCEAPLRLLLDHNSHPDGSLDTWIADPEMPESVRAKAHLNKIWGAQPDSEVMANVLYAMHLYDAKGFANAIQRGAAFLEGAQDTAGFWDSTWYAGKYYGTWVCVRLLREALPNSPGVGMARNFLIDTQRPDGGWGEGETNPLQTAFATLGFACVAQHARGNEVISAGIRHLLETQSSSGAWPASEFIRLDRARTRGARPESRGAETEELSSYASVTMTTAMCLEALLGAARLLQWPLGEESCERPGGC